MTQRFIPKRFFFLTNAPLCCVVLMQSQSRSRSIKSNWLKIAQWRCVPGACVLPLQSPVYNLHIMLHQANRKTRGSLTPSDLSQGEKGSVAFSGLPFPPLTETPTRHGDSLCFTSFSFLMSCGFYIRVKAPDIWKNREMPFNQTSIFGYRGDKVPLNIKYPADAGHCFVVIDWVWS